MKLQFLAVSSAFNVQTKVKYNERREQNSYKGIFFLLSLGPHEHMGQRFVAHNKMSGHTRAIFEFPPLTKVIAPQLGNFPHF